MNGQLFRLILCPSSHQPQITDHQSLVQSLRLEHQATLLLLAAIANIILSAVELAGRVYAIPRYVTIPLESADEPRDIDGEVPRCPL